MLLRNAGTPPLMAQSPREISTSQCFRNDSSTCTFSSLQQPPSTIPTAQRPVNSLKSLMGDRSNSTSSASCSIRSSMSSTDMWHPKQPARLTVAIRAFAGMSISFLPLDLRADRFMVEGPPADGHRVSDALLHQGPDRAGADGLVGDLKIGRPEAVAVNLKALANSAPDELEHVLAVQILRD